MLCLLSNNALAIEFSDGVRRANSAWFGCLFSSMRTQMTRFADQNEAAEASFAACQTEEQGLTAALIAESHYTQNEATTLLGYLKPKVKAKLLGKQ